MIGVASDVAPRRLHFLHPGFRRRPLFNQHRPQHRPDQVAVLVGRFGQLPLSARRLRHGHPAPPDGGAFAKHRPRA